ncbi:unnamed protein product [Pipistrellus nathusii]|uniref:Uncharacterized protein n=1 Tax=Pipistrellus nathusii TaxID=59473 RepID=A0ABN9ZZZ6_PIPNA
MNYEFHRVLPIKVSVCGPSNMAVLRSTRCQRPGMCLSGAPSRVPGRPVVPKPAAGGGRWCHVKERAASWSALMTQPGLGTLHRAFCSFLLFSGARPGESLLVQGRWVCFPPFKSSHLESQQNKISLHV